MVSAAVGAMAAVMWTDFLEPHFPTLTSVKQVIFVKMLGTEEMQKDVSSLLIQ